VGSFVDVLAELAVSQVPIDTFRSEAHAVLEMTVGFDVGLTWRLDRNEATLRGIPRSYWDHFYQRSHYETELAPLNGAATSGSVVVDRDVFSLRDRSRMGFYSEIIGPLGIATFLTGMLVVRGRSLGLVQIARATSLFKSRNIEQLRLALPVLALGEAVRDHHHNRSSLAGLTEREREIVEYARLGFTAAEIGSALGTSINTVRNQLARLYRKLGVANRAELVAVLSS
jgi:DNA-binding CsgD family transcriptional regulator